MKKISTKITATVLLLVFMFTGMFAINANATSYEVRGSCLEDHFNKLKRANNADSPPSYNTCAYVAMSMLLTYYDSYWREDFVVPVNGNNMDWDRGRYNSNTDTLERTFNANTEYNEWAIWYNNNYISGNDDANASIYRTFSINTQNTFFESYLINLGRTWGYSDGSTTFYFMWPSQIKDFLSNYLYGVRGFSQNNITVHMLSELEVGDSVLFSTMEEQITNGNPVIYCGGRFAEQEQPTGEGIFQIAGAHAMIAYDVVGSGDDKDILLHTGWTGAENITVNTTTYKYFNYIIWIEVNEEGFGHVCSDNYIDIITGNYVCSCQIYPSHPAHSIHTYHNFELINSETHGYKCQCGHTTNIQPHNLSYSYYTPTQHYKNCDDCIYFGPENHYYALQESSSSTGHNLICVCGDIISEAHYVDDYKSKNADVHYVYCECGYLIEEDYHNMAPSGKVGFSVCRECGYLRSSSGSGVIIKGEQDEPVTE